MPRRGAEAATGELVFAAAGCHLKTAESNQLQRTLHSGETSSLGPVSGPEEGAAISSDVPAWSPVTGTLPTGTQGSLFPSSDPAASSDASRCLSDDELLDYHAGVSTREQREHIDAHLDGCSDCRTIVYALLPEADPSQGGLASDAARVTTFLRGAVVSGRYRIERFVAKSGMGEVYEALDLLREKRVALKTMLCTSADDPRAVRALTLEVEHALLVSHANVCRVYELGEHRNPGRDEPPVRYLTMEFIDGETLGRRLRREPMPLVQVRAIALQLLSGLAAAHARGVLHLDLKCDNVMLRAGAEPPEALIMDFGLSRTRSVGSALHPSERELRGTPGYMAPEQLECLATSRATDVYSFGVVLFEMLAGALPFRADSLSALLLKQLRSRPPAPSLQRPGLSPALDAFVARCLEREPSRRQVDAAQALAELERIHSWEAPVARVRRSRVIAAACGVALLVFGVTAWRSFSQSASRSVAPSVARGGAAVVVAASSPATATAAPPNAAAAPEPQRAATPAPSEPVALQPVALQPVASRPRAASAAGQRSADAALQAPAAPRSDDRGRRHIPPGGFWVPAGPAQQQQQQQQQP